MCDMTHSHGWYVTFARDMTHVNESCHTYDWVMSHIWMRHVTHMNESCHTWYATFARDMAHSYVWHDLFICITQHKSFMCVVWILSERWCLRPPRTCVYFITNVGHDSFICVTWHDSFICLIHMCDMIHWYHQLIRIIHVCAMTHSYVNHLYECNVPFIYESFMCETWSSSQCRYIGSHSRWPNKQTH